jgi:hypothetical protein
MLKQIAGGVVDLGSLRHTPKSDSAPSRHVIDRMTPVGRCLNRELPVVVDTATGYATAP